MTTATACRSCGVVLPAGATFCPRCGTAAVGRTDTEPEVATIDRLRVALGDRYTVERLLGSGGMATVFLATDARHERQVAIKVLHPELAASMGAERFLREIRTAAKLQHPHILGLYDSGEADGLLYYVMPFVQGESVRDRLDREQMLPIEDAVTILLEVADALGHAHQLGIVHRDIKPENILLSGGHALVADFGIARALSATEGEKLTQTGTAIGTPLYMSPEQAMGDEVGPTSDLYSLACVGYELLTGQPPFTGANARAIMARHTMEIVPGLRLVRDTIPEEVEEAILAALAKVPADRPKSAAVFAEMMGTPLGSTAMRRAQSRYNSAPRLSTTLRRPAPMYKRPGIVVAAGLVLIGAAVSAWLMLKGGPAADADGPDPRRIAVLYFEDRSNGELAYLADGLTEGLIDALSEVRELSVISKNGSAQFRGSGVGLDSIGRALGAGTLVHGSVDRDGDAVRVTVELADAGSGAPIGRRESFAQAGTDVLALAGELARRAGGLVRSRVGEEIQLREERAGTQNVDALVLLQRAERLRKQGDSSALAGNLDALARDFGAADSMLARAEQLDPRWPEPVIERALLAYGRSRRDLTDIAAAGRWIEVGLGHIGRALAIEARDPDALELRGNLRYWKLLLSLEPDPRAAQRLLDSAQADLELAVRVRPTQAGAWATLSHLYNQVTGKSGVDINIAARNALEADAFLSNADLVLQRLFFSAYDLGGTSHTEAASRCAEGARRFPGNYRFVECRLFMMTTPRDPADVPRAWALADSMSAMTPAGDSAYQRQSGRLLVAAVLARAGQADSARRVVTRALANQSAVDPSRDLSNLAAFVYTLLGDQPQAIGQLRVYLAANPRRKAAFATDPGWWFSSLRQSTEFAQLVGGNTDN